jgi:tight adherence protein C
MNLVETLTNPQNIVAGVVGLVAFATLVTLTQPLMSQTSLETRLKAVSTSRAAA